MTTVNANYIPESTGYDLGTDSQRWDAFVQDLDVSGTATFSVPISDTGLSTITTAGKVNVSAITGVLAVANGGSASSTATGTGANVLATSPSLVTPALGAATATSLAIGTGTVITKIVVLTPSLSPAEVAANTTAEQTLSVSGLTTGDTILSCNKPAAQAGLGIVGLRVAGTDSLGITFSNNTSSPITPTASETYRVAALRS